MYEKIILDYNSLEPYLDDKTLDLHYNIHYKNYIDNLNKLLKKNNYDYRYSMEELATRIDLFDIEDRAEILYNLGGALNHELYFSGMSDKKNNKPVGNLKENIDEEYGDYEKFKKEFKKKALELKGSGSTALIIDKGKFKIVNNSNQDTACYYRAYPLIVLDMWEHSYYLKYNSNKEDYIDNWFELIDFNKIEDRFNNYK